MNAHEWTRVDSSVGVLAGYSIERFIVPGHSRNMNMRYWILNLIRVYSYPFVVLLFRVAANARAGRNDGRQEPRIRFYRYRESVSLSVFFCLTGVVNAACVIIG